MTTLHFPQKGVAASPAKTQQHVAGENKNRPVGPIDPDFPAVSANFAEFYAAQRDPVLNRKLYGYSK